MRVSGLAATLEIYQRSFSRGAALALRNWPVLASVLAYWAIMFVTNQFAMLLGVLGGIVVTLVRAACIASFLYLVEMIVRTSRVTLADFRRSFGVYLWDVVGVMFVLWIVQLAAPMLAALPQGTLILACIGILILVFFNAVPELIYLGHHATLALFTESYRFIADNWLEWFPPNLLIVAVLALLLRMSGDLAGAAVIEMTLVPLFLYFAMVVRGLLFMELNGTTRRGRIFRYRMGQ